MPSGRLALQSGSGGFFLMAMLALCFYEHLLTLNAELKYVWGRRFSGGSILFILNRYTLLVASTMAIMEDFSWVPRSGHDGQSVSSPTACNVWHRVWDVCFLLIYILYLVFAALRMYALYRSSKTVLVSVFLLGAFTPCTQGFIVFEKQPYSATSIREANISTIQWGTTYCGHLQRLGDSTEHSGHPDWIGYALVALRAHAIIFEMILLGLTWKNTSSWEVVQNGRVRTPFTTVMFQNGTLYFIAIAIASIMQLCGLLAALSHTVHGGFLYGLELLSPVVDAIISICMSRFLLNLLAAADNSYDSEYRSSRWDTILRFAQLETLGAQLRDVLDGDYEDGEGNVLSEDDMTGTNHVGSRV